jgi:hypothetical protein
VSVTTQTSEGAVEVGGHYWDAQLRTFDALESGDYDVVVFRTGYGGGKTVLGSDWILTEAVQTPDGHYLVLAPDRQKGGPATYRGFFERLPGENTVPNDSDGDPENSSIVAGYHGTKHRLTLINGAVVQLGGADVWSRFAGSEFNAIWMDEVAHYGTTDLYDLHEMLVTRQRTEAGPNVTLWTSTGNGFNQFYDITERQVDEDDEALRWSDRLKIVVGSSLNNPFLNEKEKMRAQFEGSEREAQALHGGFSAATGLVYSSFSRTTHVVSRDEVDIREDWRIYGYDYGFKDPRVLLEIGKTPADQYVAVDMYHETQHPLDDLIDPDDGTGWAFEQSKQPGEVFCDHDPEHIQKFRDAGFSAAAAEKDIDEGIDEVRGVLEVDPEIGPGLLVVEELTELINEFQSYKEDDVGTKRAEDHALDSLRYAIMGDRYVEDDSDGGTGTW